MKFLNEFVGIMVAMLFFFMIALDLMNSRETKVQEGFKGPLISIGLCEK